MRISDARPIHPGLKVRKEEAPFEEEATYLFLAGTKVPCVLSRLNVFRCSVLTSEAMVIGITFMLPVDLN